MTILIILCVMAALGASIITAGILGALWLISFLINPWAAVAVAIFIPSFVGCYYYAATHS